jgi:hypothetical protein
VSANKSTRNAQREYQHRILKAAGLDPNAFVIFELQWWRNPTNKDSLRLTPSGYKYFTKALKIPCYEIELPDIIKSKNLVQLERQFKEPYFVNTAKCNTVFGEQDAIMLQLHAGDLNRYLDDLSNTQG